MRSQRTRNNTPGTLVSSTNKPDRHHITEILLKVARDIINQTNQHPYTKTCMFLLSYCFIFRTDYSDSETIEEDYMANKNIQVLVYLFCRIHINERLSWSTYMSNQKSDKRCYRFLVT
jgi:hypothetical protein